MTGEKTMDSILETVKTEENEVAEHWVKIGDETNKGKKGDDIKDEYYIKAIECCEKNKDSNEINNFNFWGLALLRLAKIKKYENLKEKIKIFEDASKNIKDPENLLIKGALYFVIVRYEEAKELFEKSEMSILRILTFLEKEDEEKIINNTGILHLLLDSEHKDGKFFKEITRNCTQEQKNIYKNVYIYSIFIISRLHVNNENEKLVAHYQEKDISQILLFDNDSKFRLNAVDYSNDPTEGKTLLDYLFGRGNYKTDEELNTDDEAFTGCFVFDYDNLNMFRLYGKERGKEGTGLSLVFNDTFFNKNADMGIETPKNDKSSLYRCIYIDPDPKSKVPVITVGQKEEYLFYREDKADKFDDYNKHMIGIVKDVREKMNELKKMINENKLDSKIVGKLLIHLRYLVKHIAFKEEQECRIVKIFNLSNNKKQINDDNKQMFFEYLPKVSDHITKINFGPKATQFELFKSMQKYKGLEKIECEKSKNPLA